MRDHARYVPFAAQGGPKVAIYDAVGDCICEITTLYAAIRLSQRLCCVRRDKNLRLSTLFQPSVRTVKLRRVLCKAVGALHVACRGHVSASVGLAIRTRSASETVGLTRTWARTWLKPDKQSMLKPWSWRLATLRSEGARYPPLSGQGSVYWSGGNSDSARFSLSSRLATTSTALHNSRAPWSASTRKRRC